MHSSTIPRSQAEMILALRKQVRLLSQYAQKVFIENDSDYVGDIASKLRLLVTKFRSNEPLLLRLMDETGIHPKLTLDGPPVPMTPSGLRGGEQVSLEEYLQCKAIGIRVPSGEFVILNKVDLIRALAEQAGGSHEDWEMNDSLSAILSMPIHIMGMPGVLFELKSSVDAVLVTAKRFLEGYDARTGKTKEEI